MRWVAAGLQGPVAGQSLGVNRQPLAAPVHFVGSPPPASSRCGRRFFLAAPEIGRPILRVLRRVTSFPPLSSRQYDGELVRLRSDRQHLTDSKDKYKAMVIRLEGKLKTAERKASA